MKDGDLYEDDCGCLMRGKPVKTRTIVFSAFAFVIAGLVFLVVTAWLYKAVTQALLKLFGL